MADTTHTIGSTGIVKKLVDLGDGTYADAVASGASKQVAASYTTNDIASATSLVGKIGTIPATTGVLYVRADCDDRAYTHLDWNVKSDTALSLQMYRSKTIVDSAYITLANMVDADTPVLNGVSLVAESTATTDVLRAGGKFNAYGTDAAADIVNATDLCTLINGGMYATMASVVAGTTFTVNDVVYTAGESTVAATRTFIHEHDDDAAAALAACINAKATVTFATATAGDTVVVNGITYTGHADTTTAANREWDIADDSAAATGLATCINDRDTITLTSSVARDSVTIVSTPAAGGAKTITYTGKAGVSQLALNKFSIDTSDTAAAHALCAAINDVVYGHGAHLIASHAAGVVTIKPLLPTTTITCTTVIGLTRVVCKAGKGVPGITAVAASAVVSLWRDNPNVPVPTITSTSGTREVIAPAYGVPGVTASSQVAELQLVSHWDLPITVSENVATITVGEFGVPGVYATNQAATTEAANAVVTVVPKARRGYAAASTIQLLGVATTGVVVTSTLASLIAHGAAVTGVAANSTTAGTFYEQWVDGWPYCYLGLSNTTGGASTVTVGATKYTV